MLVAPHREGSCQHTRPISPTVSRAIAATPTLSHARTCDIGGMACVIVVLHSASCHRTAIVFNPGLYSATFSPVRIPHRSRRKAVVVERRYRVASTVVLNKPRRCISAANWNCHRHSQRERYTYRPFPGAGEPRIRCSQLHASTVHS